MKKLILILTIALISGCCHPTMKYISSRDYFIDLKTGDTIVKQYNIKEK